MDAHLDRTVGPSSDVTMNVKHFIICSYQSVDKQIPEI